MQSSSPFEQATALAGTCQHFDSTTPIGDVATTVTQLAHLGFCLIELDPDLTVFFPYCYDPGPIQRLRKIEEQD